MIKHYTEVGSLRFAIQTGLVFLPIFLFPTILFGLLGVSIGYLIRTILAAIALDLMTMMLLYYGDRQLS